MRFGIIGTNFVVDGFMHALLKNEDTEAVVVCSGHYENAVKFAEKYAIPKVCHGYEEMLGKVDAVYIATPNAMHYEQAKFFLEHHVPVFLEKPMCSNAKEAKSLVSIARANHTYLHHGIMPLYMPGLKTLCELVKEIGTIHNAFFVFSKYSSRFDAYLRGENPTTFRRELSNGSIMDLGIYPLSLIVSLFGKPKQVVAHASKLDTGVDAAFQGLLVYPDFSISLMASKASDTKLHCELCGEKGLIEIPHPSLLENIKLHVRGQETQCYTSEGSPFEYQLADFVKAIKEQYTEPQLVPYETSIALMEVLDELREHCDVVYPADSKVLD